MIRPEIKELIQLGKIPQDEKLDAVLFNKYDNLLQVDTRLTWEEAEACILLFSDDCHDLNWALLHAIESIDIGMENVSHRRYVTLIHSCNNEEYKEILIKRYKNSLNNLK